MTAKQTAYEASAPEEDKATHYDKATKFLNALYLQMDKAIKQHKASSVVDLDAGILAQCAIAEAILDCGTELERIANHLELIYTHGLYTVGDR